MKHLSKRWLSSSPHPDPALQPLWNGFQIALFLLPFSSLLGSLGVLLVAIGVGRVKHRAILQRPVNWGFALLSVLMLLSSVLADRKGDALLGLFNFLPFFPVFAALSELIQTPTQLRRLSWILVLASIPVVLIGFGQQFWGWAGEVNLPGLLVSWTIDAGGNPPGRMSSIFFYATVLASYLVVTFILSLGLWVEVVTGTPEHPRIQKSPFHLKVLLTVAVLGNGAALILTNSRNAWAIAVLACLAVAVYRRWWWLLGGAAGIAGTILAAAFAPSPLRAGLRQIVPRFFWARLTDELYPDRPVAQLRSTQWQFALSLAQQRPGFGWGLRSFTPLYETQMQLLVGHPHNLILMLMAETGIPSAGLMVFLVGSIVFRGVRLLQRWSSPARSSPEQALPLFIGLTAFLGCTLFHLLDITLFDVRVNLIGWILLAAIAGLVYHQKNNPAPDVG